MEAPLQPLHSSIFQPHNNTRSLSCTEKYWQFQIFDHGPSSEWAWRWPMAENLELSIFFRAAKRPCVVVRLKYWTMKWLQWSLHVLRIIIINIIIITSMTAKANMERQEGKKKTEETSVRKQLLDHSACELLAWWALWLPSPTFYSMAALECLTELGWGGRSRPSCQCPLHCCS